MSDLKSKPEPGFDSMDYNDLWSREFPLTGRYSNYKSSGPVPKKNTSKVCPQNDRQIVCLDLNYFFKSANEKSVIKENSFYLKSPIEDSVHCCLYERGLFGKQKFTPFLHICPSYTSRKIWCSSGYLNRISIFRVEEI